MRINLALWLCWLASVCGATAPNPTPIYIRNAQPWTAATLGDPVFDGFHLTGAWSLTGEQRDYYRGKGLFTKLRPVSDVNSGGPGAWEAVARYSRVDLEGGLVAGGDMTRLSLGLNWYATSQFKSTLQYGLVDLDRFGTTSTTHVVQFRMAFLLGL